MDPKVVAGEDVKWLSIRRHNANNALFVCLGTSQNTPLFQSMQAVCEHAKQMMQPIESNASIWKIREAARHCAKAVHQISNRVDSEEIGFDPEFREMFKQGLATLQEELRAINHSDLAIKHAHHPTDLAGSIREALGFEGNRGTVKYTDKLGRPVKALVRIPKGPIPVMCHHRDLSEVATNLLADSSIHPFSQGPMNLLVTVSKRKRAGTVALRIVSKGAMPLY